MLDMQVGTVIAVSGVAILIAAAMQATIGIYAVAVRSWRAARLDRARLNRFKGHSEIVLRQAEADRERRELSWNGLRKFQIRSRAYETPNQDICSFYLVPHDKRPIAPFRPGQYLTFSLPVPGQPQPVVRCYSLSESPTEGEHYRVSIKKIGLGSSYFHDTLQEGEIVDVHSPGGQFYIDEDSDRPVVLIAGGVGLTPLISMLNWLVATQSNREIWFFYGVTNRGDHAMYDHIKNIGKENANVHTAILYAEPSSECRESIDYDKKGYVTREFLESHLKSSNYEFYICGPPPMMKAVTKSLIEWGVPNEDIKYEAFVPPSTDLEDADAGTETYKVEFSRSNITAQWSGQIGTLLSLAKKSGVKYRSGCESGNCGECVTALKSGDVGYKHQPGARVAAGSCLICVGRPNSDLVLDL